MSTDPAHDLLDLLKRERTILLSGRLRDLADIADRKEGLVRAVAEAHPDQAILARIAEQSRRNAVLIEAAGAGVQAARRRIRALREAAGPIRSYGPGGQERVIGTSRPNLTRKA